MTDSTAHPTVPQQFPETGSHGGVQLRDAHFAGIPGLAAPEAFLRGALYCVYLRAYSEEGTLAAVTRDLDRIAGLGACAIWLLPIHPCGLAGRKGSAGSPYSIRDYRALDSAYGTMDDLRALVDAAHAKGIRVIIDFVANHAANDHPLIAAYPEWFAHDAAGRPTRRVADWSDVTDWNHAPEGATQHLVNSALHWIWDAGIDGFRCDVAGMVPHGFWRTLRESMLPVRADYFLLAEWQDPALHEAAFHASYDWLLYRALRDAAKGKADARRVDKALATWQANFPAAALPLRFLENHDEPRVLSFLEAERLPAYAAVAFLSGGLPLLYNGQEAAAVHRPSLFDPEPIDWAAGDGAVERIYRDLIALQRRSDPWGPGPYRHVKSNRAESVVAFARHGATRRGLVAANLGPKDVRVSLISGLEPGWSFRRVFGGDGAWSEGEPLALASGEAWVGEAE